MSQVLTVSRAVPAVTEHKTGSFKHGGASNGKHSPEYSSWACMWARCRATKGRYYRLYKSRGITVCNRWKSFQVFLDDMGVRPDKSYSLDRIDNNGNYEPSNCRWADQTTQLRNSRAARNLTHAGRTMCVGAWAKEIGIERSALLRRVQRWGVERALTTPVAVKFRNGLAGKVCVA